MCFYISRRHATQRTRWRPHTEASHPVGVTGPPDDDDDDEDDSHGDDDDDGNDDQEDDADDGGDEGEGKKRKGEEVTRDTDQRTRVPTIMASSTSQGARHVGSPCTRTLEDRAGVASAAREVASESISSQSVVSQRRGRKTLGRKISRTSTGICVMVSRRARG